MKLQKCMVLLYKGMELHSLMHGIAFLRISSIRLLTHINMKSNYEGK